LSTDNVVADGIGSILSFIPFVGPALSKGVSAMGSFLKGKELKENAIMLLKLAANDVEWDALLGKILVEMIKDDKKRK